MPFRKRGLEPYWIVAIDGLTNMRVDMEPNDTERVAAAAKFKAIQSQSAALAAATPMQTAEDLACDGGKLCGQKPTP